MRFLIVVATLALAACGQEAQQRETTEAYPVVAAPQTNTMIGAASAAGISSAVAMNVDAVRLAAPNFIVAEVDDQVEGEPFKAITLSAGDEEVFRILPAADGQHAHSIVTRSSQARSDAGEIPGQSKFAIAPPEEVSFCATELIDNMPGFACSTAEDGRFWRVYRLPEGASPAGSFDEIEPDLLHEATLVEMRWIAPRV
ncbi:hypothetical protein [Candidatus Viadribacter manganicus]|uniref:Spondin domain-containing protein n=1 Tax=Candidatus Viadribacter manganicus TaxID=1759059 RepID=A0A1B1AFG7_9PROT|nr:hypothetical protein [Candidatus Viadribacter manganicus]ANP45302.1 hypothetical protein ATE48_04940 [Candidatus Viadribacter manganicus]